MIVRLHVGPGWKAPVRSTSHILLSGGLMTVAFVLWSVGDAMLYQKLQADRFDAMIRTSPPTVRISSPAPAVTDSTESPILQLTPVLNRVDPALIGRLEIPRLGLVAMVREGLDSATLRRAVGHMPGSALPGQPGNFVIAGHRDSFFRGLRSVQTGDEVRIQTKYGSFTYRVRALSVVNPTDSEAIQPTIDRVCTLVTCFPFNYIGPAPRRFIVRGDLTVR